VFPSQTETQGLVIGEAQTFGLPAVAVEGGGASEAIRPDKTGLVVPNEPGAFADGVSKLLEDGALRGKFGRAARKQWAATTPKDTALKVLEVYESVMKRGPDVG
jgi:1,2-diacylglycerol 3-alpha-glucosyltransferase